MSRVRAPSHPSTRAFRVLRVTEGANLGDITPRPYCTVFVLSFLGLVSATGALAPAPVHYVGLINDYSPSTVKGGPYEIRGEWSLDLQGDSGTADFSAAVKMETSDYGITEA